MKKTVLLVFLSFLLGSNARALELSGRITDPRTDHIAMSVFLEATHRIPFCAEARFYFSGDAIRWEPKVKILDFESRIDTHRRYSFDAREAIEEATSGPAALCGYQLKTVKLTLSGRYDGRNDTVRAVWLEPEAHQGRFLSIPVPTYHDHLFAAHGLEFGLDSSIEVDLTPMVPRQR